jgi:hypothetical protein
LELVAILKITVFLDVIPCSLYIIIDIMEECAVSIFMEEEFTLKMEMQFPPKQW